MVEPHEEITLLSLSGDVPKKENVIKSLSLDLGPNSMRDKLVVETADHAKLTLSVSYSWFFRKNEKEDGNKMFLIKDFVGNACRTLASRIRGIVSTVEYKDFSQNYQTIVNSVIFKKDDKGNKIPFIFEDNNLVVSDVNCDQGLVPVDPEIERSLNESLSLNFKIENQSQRQRAEASAKKLKQEKEGEL